jgi:hypothetical protein
MEPETTPPAPAPYPDWWVHAPKEQSLDRALLDRATGPARLLLERLLADQEVYLLHSYANAVSIRRLGYNDHGPVHARITTYNSLKLLQKLHAAGVKTSLEADQVGTFEDSQAAVVLGCFLHDLGMTVTRDAHEWHSIQLADPFIRRYLDEVFPDDPARRVVLRSLAHEVIVGHMGHSRIHSVEAGTVLVADGTDMTRGRSRIPMNMEHDPTVGDMHRYSAGSITRVDITEGDAKPVRITIRMEDRTGLFQVEEVLMGKVKQSPIMGYLEICAIVGEQAPMFYLR